jgi:hypothetical protein
MRNLLYCGSGRVGAAETQALLTGEFSAVWTPPMYRQAEPMVGDLVWLTWQAPNQPACLLGAGVVEATPEGSPFWTNRTAPGIVPAARGLGYQGPSNMAFLRLGDVWAATSLPELAGLRDVFIGLTDASPEQVQVLTRARTADNARGGRTRG